MNCSPQTLTTLEFDKIRAHIAGRTLSAPGREEVEHLAPTDDPDLIETRLRPVLEAMDLIAFDDPLNLPRIPDTRPALAACATPGSSLSIEELLKIADFLAAARRLRTYLRERAEKYPRLGALTAPLTEHPDLENDLIAALDPATGEVKDAASPELRRIRRSAEHLRTVVRREMDAILSKLPDDVLQDRLITIRGGRFVLPIRENQKHRIQGLVHDQSASGATLFIEPMATVDSHNQIRQLELAERREIERILQEFTARIAQIRADLRADLDILGRFDAAYAKAGFGRSLDCTEPLFNTEGRIHLRAARHPLLVQRFQTENQPGHVVPLDLLLGGEDARTLVLTGPNAGGKTVALKTVGLLALMAQAGLPIPAAPKSELPVFSGIFADIGDAQSIENDLSTFSSHVSNLVRICRESNARSLVLLDEIGASTDPDQGSALAMALLQDLTARGCRTLATTHHGALKAFAHSTPGIENGSMAFNADTLQPAFRLRQKIPGSSYAFEIARRLGMPDAIVDEATRMAGAEVGRVESLIAELDAASRRHREAAETAETEAAEAERLKTELETRLKDVERRERDLTRTAQEEARQILQNANALVERTVREIRQGGADRPSIRNAHDRLRQARQGLDRTLNKDETEAPAPEVKPGDRVWIEKFGREGVVLTEKSGANRVMVEVGNLKIELALSELGLREKAPAPEPEPRPASAPKPGGRALQDLDLRGLTTEEAETGVEKYLDELYLSRVRQGLIIHGKGTGALRRAVGDLLKTHPLVKSHRLGTYGEGGNGVTFVELDID